VGVVTTAQAGDADETGIDPTADAAISGMTDLLVKAVRALGAAGEPEQASRIAGKAWWVLKDWPRQAERVNGTMHYLARLEQGPAE
jgi:hypothetical protein